MLSSRSAQQIFNWLPAPVSHVQGVFKLHISRPCTYFQEPLPPSLHFSRNQAPHHYSFQPAVIIDVAMVSQFPGHIDVHRSSPTMNPCNMFSFFNVAVHVNLRNCIWHLSLIVPSFFCIDWYSSFMCQFIYQNVRLTSYA